MDEAKVIRVPEVAEKLNLKEGSIGDFIRFGSIPEPFNWPQKKNWYWIRSEFDAWFEKRNQTQGELPPIVEPESEKHYQMEEVGQYFSERSTLPPIPFRGKYCPFDVMEINDTFIIPDFKFNLKAVAPIYKEAKKALIIVRMEDCELGLRVKRDA